MSIPCVSVAGVRSRSWFARPLSVIVVLGMIATAGEARGRVQDQASRPAAGAEVPPERQITITGRVVDARTGRGIAGARVRSGLLTPPNSLPVRRAGGDRRRRPIHDPRAAGEDPDRPGLAAEGLSRAPLPRDPPARRPGRPGLARHEARPRGRARRGRGRRGRQAGRGGRGPRAAGARRRDLLRRPARHRTGPDGSFHLDQLDPDDTLPVWARTKEATTDGVVVIRPEELKGKLTLTIDPKFAFRIRGRVTDRSGKRLAGAKVVLWWYRSYVSGKLEGRAMGIGSSFDAQTTDASGWFVFRGLWPGDRYRLDVAARGYGKAEPPEITGQGRRDPGPRHDRAGGGRRPHRRPGRRLRRQARRRRVGLQPRRRPDGR